MAFVRNFTRFSKIALTSVYKNPNKLWVNLNSSLKTDSSQVGFGCIFQNFTRSISAQSAENRLDYASEKSSVDLLCYKLDDCLMKFGALQKDQIVDILNHVMASRKITSYQALFLLQCCGNAASMETYEVRNKLVSEVWESYSKINFTPDISHYNALLQVFLENGYNFSPIEFLANLQEKNIEPNRITFMRLITKFCETGDMDGANKILQFMKDKQLSVNEGVFSSLIIGYAKANDLAGAEGIVGVMKESNVNPGPETNAALLQAYAELGNSKGFEDILKQFDEDTIFFSDAILLDIIYYLSLKGKKEYVYQILPRLKKKMGYIPRAVNITCRLLNSGLEEIAYDIFKSMPVKPEVHYQGRFFLMILAYNNYPLTKVVTYCNDFFTSQCNVMAYECALEGFILAKNVEKSLALLRVMVENKIPIREHYLYPLFCHLRDVGNSSGAYQLFEELSKFEMKISAEFVHKFVMPSLKPSDTFDHLSEIYLNLLRSGENFEVGSVYNGVVGFILQEYGLPSAARFDTDNEGREYVGRFESVMKFLLMVISGLKSRGTLQERFPELLQGMIQEGVCIDHEAADRVTKYIGDGMNSEIENLLTQITDPNLLPSIGRQNVDSIIIDVENKGDEATLEQRITLARLYLLKKNFEKAKLTLDMIKAEGGEIPSNLLVMLANAYVENDQLVEAENIFNYLKDERPQYQLNANSIIKYASALVKNDRIEDAVRVCLMHSPEDGNWPSSNSPDIKEGYYKNRVAGMLNTLVEKKDIVSLQLLQEALLNRKFALPSLIFNSQVRYHLQVGDLDKAVEEFTKLYNEHKITPAKMELSIACIEKGDTEKLQTILDISNEVHGEMNTLFDLALSFIEAGRPRQAEKVLETSGLRMNQARFDDRCLFYLNSNKIEQLEDLISSSKTVFNVNHQRLYHFLLRGQISRDDPNKALGVWLTMQEEGVAPGDDFLILLGRFLQSKGMEVPFIIPDEATVSISPPKREPKYPQAPMRGGWSSIKLAFDRGDYDAAVDMVLEIERRGEQLPDDVLSRYIFHLLKQDKLEEALARVKSSLASSSHLSLNTLKFLTSKLCDAGDHANIEFIAQYMSEKTLKDSLVATRFCMAHMNANTEEQYLNRVVKHVEGEQSLPNSLYIGFIPTSFIAHVHDHADHLLPLVRKVGEIHAESGNIGTMNNLMNAYVVTKKEEEAAVIYEKYFAEKVEFDIRSGCKFAIRNNNYEVFDSFLKLVDKHPEGRDDMKAVLHSLHINLLCKDERFEDALNVLEGALKKDLKMHQFSRELLSVLKKALLGIGKTFPYEIPNKLRREDSSSSSDDDR